MDLELDWAAVDLEHATTLYEQCMATDEAVDEAWSSLGYRWHIRSWQDRLPAPVSGDPQRVMLGLWNVSLTATGPGGSWSFGWTGDGWFAR
jgi:hypothetical protein